MEGGIEGREALASNPITRGGTEAHTKTASHPASQPPPRQARTSWAAEKAFSRIEMRPRADTACIWESAESRRS